MFFLTIRSPLCNYQLYLSPNRMTYSACSILSIGKEVMFGMNIWIQEEVLSVLKPLKINMKNRQ
jgi:hypothetical protein